MKDKGRPSEVIGTMGHSEYLIRLSSDRLDGPAKPDPKPVKKPKKGKGK